MIIHLRQIPTRRKIRIPLILKMEKNTELNKTQGQKIKKLILLFSKVLLFCTQSKIPTINIKNPKPPI
jgi:hypothetical protein